jgi:hypothetical protein
MDKLVVVRLEPRIQNMPNKPLEWTGDHEFTSGSRYSLPATQGQR